MERVIQLLLVFAADTYTGILYGENKLYPVIVYLPISGKQLNRALIGILRRISQQVYQYLLYADAVTVKTGGKLSVAFQSEGQTSFLHPGGNHVHCIVKYFFQMIIRLRDFHFAGFQPGEIKNIIYDIQQILSCLPKIDGILLNLLVLCLTENQLVHAENGIDRHTDFVRHIGQEPALGPIGRHCFCSGILCFFLGSIQSFVLLRIALHRLFVQTGLPANNKADHKGYDKDSLTDFNVAYSPCVVMGYHFRMEIRKSQQRNIYCSLRKQHQLPCFAFQKGKAKNKTHNHPQRHTAGNSSPGEKQHRDKNN